MMPGLLDYLTAEQRASLAHDRDGKEWAHDIIIERQKSKNVFNVGTKHWELSR